MMSIINQNICIMKKINILNAFGGISFFPSKKFATPKRVKPGMFYYADGLIFPELIKDNQVSAIVGYAGKDRVLGVGLRETELPWSSEMFHVGIPGYYGGLGPSGPEVTKIILAAAAEQGKTAEAAEWCARYDYDGIEAGKCFLPIVQEMECICMNREALRQSFSLLGLDGFRKHYYWTATEYYINSVYIISFEDGTVTNDYYLKNDVLPVRCVIDLNI